MTNVPLMHESVLAALPAALAKTDLDADAIIASAGLQQRIDGNGEPMVLGNAVVGLFERLADRLNDPAFGLHYAQAYPVGASGAFGYILMNAKDMRSAVRAIARYTELLIAGIEVKYESIQDGAQLTWRYPLGLLTPNIQYNSFLASAVILRLRATLSPDWCPKMVQFTHREPGNFAAYKRIFGPNIAFDQPVNRFTFSESNLVRLNPSADPNLFKTVKQLGDILLASRASGSDFRDAVANQIVDHLGVAAPTLESVAAELGIGARTVQRRLAERGTSFETLVGEARRAVAERLLRETDLSLTDIAFMLGFSELSAFTRAANRWFGAPPREFRALQRKTA